MWLLNCSSYCDTCLEFYYFFQEMPSCEFIPFFFFNGSQNWAHLPIFCTPWVYLPELLERVSAGEVLEANSDLWTGINFTVFSFVMTYNNKNVGSVFGCNFTFYVPNHHLWFSKFPIFKKIFGFIQYDFKCFGDKDSLSIPETEEFVVRFLWF